MLGQDIVTRAEAKQKGLSKFFTGEPCSKGHISHRYVNDGKCSTCKGIRAKSHYHANLETKADLQYRRLYGITKPEADTLKSGGCEICGTKLGKLCIDHNHTTGDVRGCLCNECNIGIGKLKDSPYLLNKAIQYLQKGN